jgi:hypothetical protein
MTDDEDQRSQNSSTLRIAIGLVLALGLAGGGAWWFLNRSPADALPVAQENPSPPAAAPTTSVEPPAIQHPLEDAPVPAEPLPPVNQSDAVLSDALRELLGAPAVQSWLVQDELARRFVATVDNLPRNVPLEKRRPLRTPPEPTQVDRTITDAAAGTERITLSARNAARFDAAVALFVNADAKALADSYRRYYPLLQQAYQDLGYPDRYFNDRVVQAIDDMLRAPELTGAVTLIQPKVLYQYEDPSLEGLSSGQKLLLRMGPVHARAVKTKLRELRALIAKKGNI